MAMTVSMLDAYLEQMPAVRVDRIRDLAEAGVYAQADAKGRDRLWQAWGRQAASVATEAARRSAAALFVVNGKSVGLDGLRRFFRQAVGRGVSS